MIPRYSEAVSKESVLSHVAYLVAYNRVSFASFLGLAALIHPALRGHFIPSQLFDQWLRMIPLGKDRLKSTHEFEKPTILSRISYNS